jgi:hypothetical protein
MCVCIHETLSWRVAPSICLTCLYDLYRFNTVSYVVDYYLKESKKLKNTPKGANHHYHHHYHHSPTHSLLFLQSIIISRSFSSLLSLEVPHSYIYIYYIYTCDISKTPLTKVFYSFCLFLSSFRRHVCIYRCETKIPLVCMLWYLHTPLRASFIM